MKPEKLNLWDRFFNRYTKILISTYREKYWADEFVDTTSIGDYTPAGYYYVTWGVFRKIDRLTGSETIVREVI